MRDPNNPLFDPLADSEIEEPCEDCKEAPMVQGFGSTFEVATREPEHRQSAAWGDGPTIPPREEQPMSDEQNQGPGPDPERLMPTVDPEAAYRRNEEELTQARSDLAALRRHRDRINARIKVLVAHERRMARIVKIASEKDADE